jgi:hypothetical protein
MMRNLFAKLSDKLLAALASLLTPYVTAEAARIEAQSKATDRDALMMVSFGSGYDETTAQVLYDAGVSVHQAITAFHDADQRIQ